MSQIHCLQIRQKVLSNIGNNIINFVIWYMNFCIYLSIYIFLNKCFKSLLNYF